MGDAERLRTYLAGWDDAIACLADTLSWVPDEQLPGVVAHLLTQTTARTPNSRRNRPAQSPVLRQTDPPLTSTHGIRAHQAPIST